MDGCKDEHQPWHTQHQRLGQMVATKVLTHCSQTQGGQARPHNHTAHTQQCGTGVVPTPFKCTKATTKHTNNATKAQGVMGCVVAHTRVGDKGGCLVGVSCLTNTTLPTLWLLVGWQAECTHTHSKAQPSMCTMQPMWWHKQRQRGTKALTQHTTSWCCCSASHHHHHGCTALHCTK